MTAADVNVTELVARALAGLAPGEDWPTNEALGGSPTGTRDDEYHAAMLDQARDALADPEVVARAVVEWITGGAR